jgi:hypothetical protein
MRRHLFPMLVLLITLAITGLVHATPTGKAGTENGDTAVKDVKTAKVEDPEAGQPEEGKSEAGQPEEGQPEAGQPEEGKSEAGQPEEGQPEEGKSEAGQPEAGQPEAGQPEAGKSPGSEPAEIEDDDNAVAVLKQLVDAAKSGHWSLVVAFGIMLLVYLLQKFGLADKLGKKAAPWIAATTGILGYVAAALLVEGATIPNALTGGFLTGAAAVGLWEMLFKHFMKAKEPGANSAG